MKTKKYNEQCQRNPKKRLIFSIELMLVMKCIMDTGVVGIPWKRFRDVSGCPEASSRKVPGGIFQMPLDPRKGSRKGSWKGVLKGSVGAL